MRLSTDPPFLHCGFVTNCPFNFDHLFLLFFFRSTWRNCKWLQKFQTKSYNCRNFVHFHTHRPPFQITQDRVQDLTHVLRTKVWKKYLGVKTTLNKAVLEPRVSPAFAITYFCNHCNIRFENTSKYVDTLTLFPKTWTKGHWPLDDLWPHVCWGHMCDSTQGSLCPSPMTIHQCMWIQWSILQNTTYIHILHTYYIAEWVIT